MGLTRILSAARASSNSLEGLIAAGLITRAGRLFRVAAVAGLCACAPGVDLPRVSLGDVAPPILQVLPPTIEGFAYRGAKTYPTPLGYALRYRLERDQDVHADVFVYPVPREAENLGHVERVKMVTEQSLGDIKGATAQGTYSKYRLLDGREFRILSSYTTRIDVYLVKDNLERFSLLFLTERGGKLIKARMTMPDNYSNRNDENWQRFVERIFTLILENIGQA